MMNKLFFFSFILLLAIPCCAGTISVKPDGSGDYPTIQAAIEATVTGDEVVLSIGTYIGDGNRDIDFGGRSITVRSTDPQAPFMVAATIIDCQGGPGEPHRGFSFVSGEDANSVLKGLTITNGYGPDEESPPNFHSAGGGIYCESSSPTISNCTFKNNIAGYEGGGMYNYLGSNPKVTGCTFTNNLAVEGDGGGMFNRDSSPTVIGCVFTGNGAFNGGGMCNFNPGTLKVTGCTFSSNSAAWGGGMSSLNDSSMTVTSCIFSGNSAFYSGGGMINWTSGVGSPTVSNCTFSGNVVESDMYGGGGGMANWHYSYPIVTNSILWGNTPQDMYDYSDGPYESNAVVTFCDIQGGWEGTGNIDENPLFITSGFWDSNGTPSNANDDYWVDGDYHLMPDSPCIDAGDPVYILDPDYPTDLDGNPRIVCGRIDMGAYEMADPVVLLDLLYQDIIDLELQQGVENSLLAKLEAALQKLIDDNENNNKAAINSLEAFLNVVEAQRGKKISEEDADYLVTTAQQIIDLLSSE